eukprot:272029-Pleurochrysis_carterae.AAC.1
MQRTSKNTRVFPHCTLPEMERVGSISEMTTVHAVELPPNSDFGDTAQGRRLLAGSVARLSDHSPLP